MVAGGATVNDTGKLFELACRDIGTPELVVGACRASEACEPPAGASGGNVG